MMIYQHDNNRPIGAGLSRRRTYLSVVFWVNVAINCSLTPFGTVLAQGRIPVYSREDGRTEVRNARVMLIERITLASPRAGVLAFVELREGDCVEARQVVASLDASVARANLAIARHRASSTIDRRFARKSIELSQFEYDKARLANSNIEGGGVFTEIDLQRLKLSLDKSILQLEQAESEAKIHALAVNQLAAELNSHAVVAPFAGRVTKVHRAKGETVALGDPIADVVNLDRVRVEGFVSIPAGLRIRAGSPVMVQLDLPDVDLAEERIAIQGKLVFVDVGVEPVSGQIRVWAEVPNPEGILRGGLPARMTILEAPTLTSR
jgi:multidrug efflux pump subunit AcrA (membrane-fusion protein)